MDIFHSYTHIPDEAKGAVVALGAFDGVHLGHQAILSAVRKLAARLDRPAGVVTFHPHPRRVLDPELPPFRITNSATRLAAFGQYGVQCAFVIPFTLQLAGLSAEVFAERILVEGLQVSGVVVGENFRFGYQRQGTPDLLRQLGKTFNFAVEVIPSLRTAGGEVCSSSAIRKLLQQGDIRAANGLIGRPWEIRGLVEEGDKRGTDIGYPTANVAWGDHIVPRYGVYAVLASCRRMNWRPAVANFGVRPTVTNDTAPRLEVHVFDYKGELYGEQLNVRFLDFLRPEQKFSSVAALKDQIARDCDRARLAMEPVMA